MEKDFPTQVSLAQCSETEIDALGTWSYLNLAKEWHPLQSWILTLQP